MVYNVSHFDSIAVETRHWWRKQQIEPSLWLLDGASGRENARQFRISQARFALSVIQPTALLAALLAALLIVLLAAT